MQNALAGSGRAGGPFVAYELQLPEVGTVTRVTLAGDLDGPGERCLGRIVAPQPPQQPAVRRMEARGLGGEAIDGGARAGFRVALNTPYSGGHTTRHYGRPRTGVHALQIEVARSLYMDERRLARRPEMADVAAVLAALTVRLAEVAHERLGGTLRAAE